MFLSVHIKIFSSCAAITKYQNKWDAKDETELSSIILTSNAYAIKQFHVVIVRFIIKYYKYELIKYIRSKKKYLVRLLYILGIYLTAHLKTIFSFLKVSKTLT